MKFILPSSVFLFCVTATAQNNIGRVTDYAFYQEEIQRPATIIDRTEVIREQKLESETKVRTVKKFTSTETKIYDVSGKIITREYSSNKGDYFTETYAYDSEGHNISLVRVNGKGEVRYTLTRQYNEQGKLILFTEKFGKEFISRSYRYDQNGNTIYQSGADKKGHPMVRKKSFDPITNAVLISEFYTGKDTINPVKWMEYDYYEDGSKKTIRYFEKGELEYTWNFDCKPEGVVVDLKKTDSSLVCKKEEVDENGNRITWLHEFHSDGYPVKVKYVAGQDGKTTEKTTYANGDLIIEQAFFFKDGGHLILYRNKDGEMSVESESVNNTEGHLVYSTSGNGKWQRRTLYFYDGNTLIKTVNSGKWNNSEETYSYSYRQ